MPFSPSFLYASLSYWNDTIRSLQSCLLTRLNNRSSQPFLIVEGFQRPLIIFVSILWAHSNRSLSFLCWGPCRWDRIPSLALLSMLILVQSSIGLLFWTASCHCQASLSSTSSPSTFPSGLLSISSFPQSGLIPGVILTQLH